MQSTNGKQKPESSIQRVEVVRELAPTASDVDVLAVIERRNAMLERILQYAISATHSGQWVDQQGKPYPTAAAAEVMARRCAVRIENVHTEKVPSSDDKGPFYLYVSSCTASLPGGYDSIQAMGTCSSRDTFLGTETRAGRALSEIDEGNILKAAYSNMLVNSICRLLGVRNLTWEQLSQYGINQGGAARVDYQAGAKGGGTPKASAGAGDDPEIKWGNAAGTRLSKLSDKDLCYYLKSYKEKVAKKDEKWHASNVKWHDALEAERKKRHGKSNPPAPATNEPPPPGDEDFGPGAEG
jgi:hypothetical protein